MTIIKGKPFNKDKEISFLRETIKQLMSQFKIPRQAAMDIVAKDLTNVVEAGEKMELINDYKNN